MIGIEDESVASCCLLTISDIAQLSIVVKSALNRFYIS